MLVDAASEATGSGQNLPRSISPQAVGPGGGLLFRELTHRINNELTSTVGFVSLVTARSRSIEVKTAFHRGCVLPDRQIEPRGPGRFASRHTGSDLN
jgi:hypothetical protein